MLEIYQVGQDLFQIHTTTSTVAYEGTQLGILVYCVSVLKMLPRELQAALTDMIRKDHDSANFGINQIFIYSFNREAKYGNKAS